MKTLFIALALVFSLVSSDVMACGSHSCGPQFNFNLSLSPGYGYGYGFYSPFGRPYFYGRGAGAFRRSFRLQNRAMRAAWNGNFGRAARLQARSNAAFWRGVRRGGGFAVRPFWL